MWTRSMWTGMAALGACFAASMSSGISAQAPEGDVVIVVEDAEGVNGPTRATVVPIEGSEGLPAPRPEDAPVVVIFPPGSQVHVRRHAPDVAVPPPPAVAPPAYAPPAYAPPAHALVPPHAAAIEARIRYLLTQRPRIGPRITMMALGGAGAYGFAMASITSSIGCHGCERDRAMLGAFAVLSAAVFVTGTVLLFRGLKVRGRVNREIRTLRQQLAISF